MRIFIQYRFQGPMNFEAFIYYLYFVAPDSEQTALYR